MESARSQSPDLPGGTVTFLFTDIEGSTKLLDMLGETYGGLLTDHHLILRHAFETKDPRFGYATMAGFIEENVVEAMAIFICHKIGLEKDPIGYFAKHDGGSHMLSVVLFEYFGKYPKSSEQSFEAYFLELFQKMPVGSLDRIYQAIMNEYD